MMLIRVELLVILFVNALIYLILVYWKLSWNDAEIRALLSSNVPSPVVLFQGRVNACILILVRTDDLETLVRAVTNLEKHFNNAYNYPYVLLNNEEFDNKFKQRIANCTRSKIEFGVIPVEHWKEPSGLNQTLVQKSIKEFEKDLSYHQMCRFYSGFFFRHEFTLKYEYFMRIDVDSEFMCPFGSDPFRTLQDERKLYGFVIAAAEFEDTIPTLWPTIKKWINVTHTKLAPNNSMRFISDDNGISLSDRMCTFYNNFEVASFALFRNPTYIDYFNYLDKQGGFFHERWGDAPVHTYYVALMLNYTDVHLFKNIFYQHIPYSNRLLWDTQCKYPQFINVYSECSSDWINAGLNRPSS